MQKKIITTLCIIFFTFIILSVNSVFGVGRITHSWKTDVNSDGKPDLVFRTFTTPHSDTVKAYHETTSNYLVGGGWEYKYNNTDYNAKWIYVSGNGMSAPDAYHFRTMGFAFHTDKMSNYPDNTDSDKIGYSLMSDDTYLGYEMSSITSAVANSSAKYTKPESKNSYSSVVFKEVLRTNGTFSTVTWGTLYTVKDLFAVGQIEYRYTIVNIDGANVYVGDWVIYNADMIDLIKKAKEKGKTNMCYVSDIIISGTLHSNGGYEVARKADEFFDQYNKKGYSAWFWSAGTRGRAGEAEGSVLNLYDNELYFPQMSKRTVLVRHINIGNTTSISASVVNNGVRIPSPYEQRILTIDETATVRGSNTSSNYSGYEEYYEGLIDIESKINKVALPNTDYYKCIGYNVGVANSKDGAQANVNTLINSGKYTSGTSVTVPAKDLTSDSDYIVIDFYYSEYEKDVYVNHLYVDKDGYVKEIVKQNIIPNNTAVENTNPTRTINRTNTGTQYTSEVYKKRLGYTITTRYADSLKDEISKNETLKYMGYERFNEKTNASSLVGTQRVDLNTGTTASLTSNKVQVNFYYYLENQVEEQEPKKEIDGEVFVKPTEVDGKGNPTDTGVVAGSCYDNVESLNVTTIPSGTKATVGIKEIPRYMVGAIQTEYISPVNTKNTINFTLNFTMGTQKKTYTYKDLEYRVGYYKITDMAVYKLTNTTIYDANKGHDGTSGDSLFNWNGGKLSITPKNMNLNVVLTGINNKSIANNSTAINNINNYVAISIEDKHGNTSTSGTSALNRTYLTTDELAEVDANLDGSVTGSDKTKAKEDMDSAYKDWQNKISIRKTRQTEYDNAVSRKQTLETNKSNAEKELNRLLGIYNDVSSQRDKKISSKSAMEGDLDNYNKDLTTKNSELTELKTLEETKLSEKDAADLDLKQKTEIKDELYTIYQNSIKTRNELYAAAQCDDTLPEYVQIYVEIYKEEIEAANKCIDAKEAYNKNIEDRVVENAQQIYESYLDNEWLDANNLATTKNTDYNTAVSNRENKEKEISKLTTDINNLEVLIGTASRDLSKYEEDYYKPAKKAYEDYRDGAYATAVSEYNAYIEGNYVGKAQTALEEAQSAEDEAKEVYDKALKYKENLYNKYDEYKALYDEFMSITGTNKQVAKTLGLKLNISVQNMSVKVNKTQLTESKKNKETKQFDLATYMDADKGDLTYQVITDPVEINKDVYSNIGSTILSETDYTNVNDIEQSVLNGKRVLAGKAEYEAKVVIGSKSNNEIKDIKDTVYYSNQTNDEKTVIFKLKNTKISRTYKVDNSAATASEKYEDVKPINIYTPITVTATMDANNNQIVDQTKDTKFDASMIQINTPFTINFSSDDAPEHAYTKLSNANKYSRGYYIKFDFDVHEVTLNGKTYKSGNRIAAGTWIGPVIENSKGKAYIKAQAYGNEEENNTEIISEEKSHYYVRAYAYNTTNAMLSRSTKYSVISEMIAQKSDLKDILLNICVANVSTKQYYSPIQSYFAETEYEVVIINRAYDFRVTDVKDISWKSVFRKSAGSTTNKHTGTVYYAGTTKWNSDSDKTNSIVSRSSSEIGRNPLRILPVGPYKNTDRTYIKAPKLGYRFSFDMKVTGSYYSIVKDESTGKETLEVNENKKVAITTKFYYIAKNGNTNTYLEESDGTKKGIYLFYKNDSGKYVRIDNSGGSYDLRFTPNDGYRLIEDSNTSTLSTKSISLGNLRNITLTKDMATVADNRSAITYYGEYKLPNSTIAVEVDENGTYDINSPLKDGYIGVVFDIVVYSGKVNIGSNSQDVILSYSKDTKENQPNTSQWDYEGFLGFTDYGNKVKDGTLTMKLEKGTWKITDEIYNKIKGTVMLYDLDQRAATDYE